MTFKRIQDLTWRHSALKENVFGRAKQQLKLSQVEWYTKHQHDTPYRPNYQSQTVVWSKQTNSFLHHELNMIVDFALVLRPKLWPGWRLEFAFVLSRRYQPV
jgi:hypothetical protein